MGPKDRNNNQNSRSDSSRLSWEVANWFSTFDGYTSSDAAADTGVSEREAKEAMDTAREDGSN